MRVLREKNPGYPLDADGADIVGSWRLDYLVTTNDAGKTMTAIHDGVPTYVFAADKSGYLRYEAQTFAWSVDVAKGASTGILNLRFDVFTDPSFQDTSGISQSLKYGVDARRGELTIYTSEKDYRLYVKE